MEKKLDENYSRMLRETSPGGSTSQGSSCTAIYHPSRKLSKLDEPGMRDTAGEYKDELINDVLLWTPSHGRAKAVRPTRTYIQQLCVDTGYSPEDLSEAREEWLERVRDSRVDGATWWWWWWWCWRLQQIANTSNYKFILPFFHYYMTHTDTHRDKLRAQTLKHKPIRIHRLSYIQVRED